MKLRVSAPTSVLHWESDNRPVTDRARVAALDGLCYNEECFSDYLMDDKETKDLAARGVSGGYLRFRFDATTDQLWAETVYDLCETLRDQEIKSLLDYTRGQWSDGIGENFVPEYGEKTGLFLAISGDDATAQVI